MLFFFLHFRNYVKVKKCSSRADENVKQRKISRYCKWVSSFLSVCAGLFLLFFNRALCQNRSLRRRFNLRGFNFFSHKFYNHIFCHGELFLLKCWKIEHFLQALSFRSFHNTISSFQFQPTFLTSQLQFLIAVD